jgi:DNA (cytosine-5)-methyltransferase 1
LFFEFARILKGLQPKTFVAENVSGLVMGKAKAVFDEVYRTLEDCGYKVSARILNAKYFGVAQNRPRLIFVGVRNDLAVEPSHPMPQTAPTPIKDVLTNLTLTEEQIAEAMYPAHYSVIPLMNQMKPGEKGSDYHPNGSYFGLARLDFDKPANTILQSDAKHISCSALHPIENRKLTIPELKRVASFPDNFILTGTYKQQWERIGRAVPPLMMKSIATHIRYKILDKINNIENDYNPTKFNFVVPEEQEQFDVCEGNDFREYKPEPIDKMKDYQQDTLL